MIRSHDSTTFPLPRIRRASSADLVAIETIEKESFSDPWDAEILREALGFYPATFFVAICDGAVAGFIFGAPEDTGENIYGHICNLAVSTRFRGRGIGRLLVNRLEQQFAIDLATAVQLEVRVSNTAAQQFYRRLRYREMIVVDRYYANGEDAILMMKWFRF